MYSLTCFPTPGHLPATWSDAVFLHHVYGGIYWAATGKGFRAK